MAVNLEGSNGDEINVSNGSLSWVFANTAEGEKIGKNHVSIHDIGMIPKESAQKIAEELKVLDMPLFGVDMKPIFVEFFATAGDVTVF